MSILKKIFYTLFSITIFTFLLTNIAKADTVEVTTETLNLREEPSTESDIVALISIGEECELISEDGDWYEVKYGEYTGYISKEYAKKVGSTSETTPEEENTQKTNTESENNSNTVTSENTTTENSQITTNSGTILQGKIAENTGIRIVPLISSSIIENIKKDAEVAVIEQINNWVYIQTDTVSGWIRSNAIDITEVKTDTNKTDNKKQEEDNKEDNKSDEKIEETTFEAKTMYTEDYVNIRSTPTTEENNIIMTVAENTPLEVIGEEGSWYKVNTSEGEAYVSKDVLVEEKKVTDRGSVDRSEAEEAYEKEDSKTSNSSSSSAKAREIVEYAKEFLGVPYVYGGASPSGFDCSGFTMYVFDHFGISMGHGAQMQSREGSAVKADKSSKSSLLNNLEVGDLVFFLDYETMDEIGHCGIYIGDGEFIHASSGSGYCVKINSLLPGEYYNTRYCAARRVL